MTNILLKYFVRNNADLESSAVRGQIGTLSGLVGIFANLLLFLGKMMVGLLSGSVSIAADALNNLSDASSSILTLIGFRLAGKPADAHHPYGQARLEYLSGLAVAVMIMLIGFELGQTALEKILHPVPVQFSVPVGIVLVLSIVIKLWLSGFQQKLGNMIHSSALMATAVDSRNDCISTLAVLAAAVVESAFDLRVDGIIGLAVAGFILYSGWNTAKETISPLLGEGANPELQKKIVDYIEESPYVLGHHDLMVHDYGPGQQFASLHVEMDCREDPMFCHEIIDDLERECMNSHGIHLVIHYDPVVTDDPELQQLKEKLQTILKECDERLNLHDFRMVRGERHINLIFDIALPLAMADQKQALQTLLTEKMNENASVIYHLVITFDMGG